MQFFRWAYKTTALERLLLTQKADLKFEQSKLSMVDQFARFSRIQRKINSIEQELTELQSQRLRNNLIVRMLCTYVVRFIFGMVLTCLGIYYRNTPLLSISSKFDLSPFTYILSYPNAVDNTVSVPVWIMCCTTVGSIIKINI